MRYFKFVGDHESYCWSIKPIEGKVYREDHSNYVLPTGNRSSTVIEMYYGYPLDWEEVSQEYYLIINQKEL